MSDDEPSDGQRRSRRTPEEWAETAVAMREAAGFELQFGDRRTAERLAGYANIAGLLAHQPLFLPIFTPFSFSALDVLVDEAIKNGVMPLQVVTAAVHFLHLMTSAADHSPDGVIELVAGEHRLKFNPRDLLKPFPEGDDSDEEDGNSNEDP